MSLAIERAGAGASASVASRASSTTRARGCVVARARMGGREQRPCARAGVERALGGARARAWTVERRERTLAVVRVASARSRARGSRTGTRTAATKDPRARPSLLRMSTPAAVWYVAWPTTVIGLMRSLFSLTDTFWVGKLGIAELNALCSNAFAGWMLYLLCSVVAYGVQNRVSVKVGAEKYDDVGPVLRDGLCGAALTYAFIAMLIPFAPAYTATLGIKTGSTAAIAQSHLRASLLGAAGLCFSNVLEATLRGFGSMKPAIWVTAFMVLCNMVLDPLLIFGVGPFPKLGVVGAAVGTSISTAIGALFFYRILVKEFEVKIPFSPPNVRVLKDMIAIGAPIAVAGIVFAMVYVGLGRILTSIDPVALTAMGLGQQWENIPYTVTEAFRIGTSTIVGQWIGARNALRARDSGWNAIRFASLTLIPFGIFFVIFAPQCVALLTQDAGVTRHAVSYMYWNFPIVSFMALECAVEGAFTGTGITYPVLIIAILLNFSRLPLAAVLAPTYGVAGVWFTIVVTQVVKTCLKTLWLRKLFNDLIADENKPSPA